MFNKDDLLKISPIKKYFKRIKIDFLTKKFSHYKEWKDIFFEFFSFNFENDFPSIEFKYYLKKFLYELETIIVTLRKIIKNDISILEEMKSINLRAYFILDNLYEYNNIDFNEIISRIENENLNFIDLFPIFDFIFKKIYLFSRLELTSEEKANISRLFPKVTNFNRSFVFFAFTKICVLGKKKFNYEDRFITFNFGRLCDSFAYIYDNALFEFIPLIFRYFGYNYISIKNNRERFFDLLDNLLDIKQKLEEFRDLPPFIEDDELYEEDEEENLKVIKLPDDIVVSIDLFSYFFKTNIFDYIIEFPDYIYFGLRLYIFKPSENYKIISNEDNFNFFVFMLKLLIKFLPYIKEFKFKDSKEFEEKIERFSKIIYEYENFVDKNYLKILSELQNILKTEGNFDKNEFLKRLSDELNFIKKKFIYPNYYYHHYTAIALSENMIEPFYSNLEIIFNLFNSHLKYLDRRTTSESDISKYFLNYNTKLNLSKNEPIFNLLKESFPENEALSSLNNINLFYILYHIINIFNYFLNSKSSIFNFYPSNRFIKNEENLIFHNEICIKKKLDEESKIYNDKGSDDKFSATNSSSIKEKESLKNKELQESKRTPDFFYYKKMSYKLNILEKQAFIDSLTGCYNKNFLNEKLLNEVEINDQYAFLYFDLDNFKYFNDNYTHKMGDEVLKYFGDILMKSIRKKDYAIRIGGDEFLIIAKCSNISNSYLIAKRVLERIKNLNNYLFEIIRLENKKLPEKNISCSVGVAFYESSIKETIEKADKAMYKAKENGKNKICILTKDKNYQIFNF
jgi:diguanylate cyclase (GGDEF)-like protein